MSLAEARRYVDVNPTQKRTSGWLSVADVRPTTGTALLGAEYETDACIADVGGEFVEDCLGLTGGFTMRPFPAPPNNPNTPDAVMDEKSFQGGPDVVEGSPFAVFAGVECAPPFITPEGAQAKAARRLGYVEDRQVDFHIARLITEQGNHMGDCPLSNMIMNADYAAALEYGGYAVIGMSAPLLLCAAAQNLISPCPPDECVSSASMWRTANGTYVTSIAHNDAVTASNFFLTGQVTLLQGPVETHQGINPKTNQSRGLAERIYVPLIECMAYHATATCDMPITP